MTISTRGAEMKMLQLNCNNQVAVSVELNIYMMEEKVCVALLQDHHVQPTTGRATGFPGMRVYSVERGGQHNRAAIVVGDSGIEAVPIDRLTCEWGVCAWIKGDFGELFVCSIYCKFDQSLDRYTRYIDEVVHLAGDTPLLIGMDSNAKSSLWHSKVSMDIRGQPQYGDRAEPLEESITRNGLSVLNQPSDYYTFVSGTRRGQSDIDITLGNEAHITKFASSWQVLPGVCSSDHNALIIDMSTNLTSEIAVAPGKRWKTEQADWVAFRDDLIRRTSLVQWQNLSAEQMQQDLDIHITDACDAHLTKQAAWKPQKPRWWSPRLSELRRNKTRTRKIFQRLRRHGADPLLPETLEARSNSIRACRLYARAIQMAKGDDWRSFVSTNGNRDPWGTVYRICRSKGAPASIGCFQTPTGTTSNWSESAEVLLGKFLPPLDPLDAIPDLRQDDPAPPPITMPELSAAMRRLKNKGAPGLDGKTAPIYKQVFKAIPDTVLMLYNKCLSESRFPKPWKEGNIITFLKAPDRNRAEPSSFRPITLLPIPDKVMERVLVNRAQAKINDPSPTQFGFTAGMSTNDAWIKVQDIVNASEDNYMVAIMIDFEGAFDHLNWGPILQKLQEIGCQEVSMWRDYFSDRKSCMRGRRDVIWRDVSRGCPQGSICGPMMWNLVMEDLLTTLTNEGIQHVAYADDLLLLVPGQSRVEIERAAAEAIAHASRWGARCGVRLSVPKTEAMMVRGHFNIQRPPRIIFDGNRVRFVPSTKYLGVHVSSGLKFDVHLREIRSKLLKVVMPLKRVLKHRYGLKRGATMTWLKGLLVPLALYGAPVWHHLASTVKGRQRIDTIQRVAIFACARACRTVSTIALQVLTQNAPWDLQARRLSTRFKIKRNLPLDAYDLLTPDEAANRDWPNRLDERVMTLWQERWANSTKGRVTYRYINNVRFDPGPFFDPPTRLMFLITGHGSMNVYLHKHTRHHTKECVCGWPFEDWEHVLAHCPKYDNIRDLEKMGIRVTDGVLYVNKALQNKETYEELVRFANTAFGRRQTLLAAIPADHPL